MTRTIQVQISIEVPDNDKRTADEIAATVVGNLHGVSGPMRAAKPVGGSLRDAMIVLQSGTEENVTPA